MKALVIYIKQPSGTPHVTLDIKQGDYRNAPATRREQQYADEIMKMLQVEIPKLAKQLGAVETIAGTTPDSRSN